MTPISKDYMYTCIHTVKSGYQWLLGANIMSKHIKKETNLSKALFSYKQVLNCYCQRFSCDVKQFKYVNHLLDLRLAHCD